MTPQAPLLAFSDVLDIVGPTLRSPFPMCLARGGEFLLAEHWSGYELIVTKTHGGFEDPYTGEFFEAGEFNGWRPVADRREGMGDE